MDADQGEYIGSELMHHMYFSDSLKLIKEAKRKIIINMHLLIKVGRMGCFVWQKNIGFSGWVGEYCPSSPPETATIVNMFMQASILGLLMVRGVQVMVNSGAALVKFKDEMSLLNWILIN